MSNHSHPIYIFGVYIPPKTSAVRSHECLSLISDAVLKIKTEVRESHILIGGDFNHRDMSVAIGDYNDLEILPSPPLRGEASLDVTACSFGRFHHSTTVHDPLETEDGQSKSDHSFIVHSFNIAHRHDFEWIRYRVRRINDRAIEKYDALIKAADLEVRLDEDPDSAV